MRRQVLFSLLNALLMMAFEQDVAQAAPLAFQETGPTTVDISPAIGAKNNVSVQWTFDTETQAFDRIRILVGGFFTCQILGGEELGLAEDVNMACRQNGFAGGILQTEVDFVEDNTSVISDRIGRYANQVSGLDAYMFISDSDVTGVDAPPLRQTISCDTTTCETYDIVPEPSTVLPLTAGLIVLATFRVSRWRSKRRINCGLY